MEKREEKKCLSYKMLKSLNKIFFVKSSFSVSFVSPDIQIHLDDWKELICYLFLRWDTTRLWSHEIR